MLNAKVHADEAKIVAMAGHKGAVTVATNMAGRGTDIMLGGSVDFLADAELREPGPRPGRDLRGVRGRLAGHARADQGTRSPPSTTRSASVGGLYVVGTERHESRRIDNQLRGRSGRQGDPGESRFYLSLEDELMRLFKSDWVDRVLQVLKIPDDVPIENKRVTGAIANAQGQVESQNFESRKNVLKYDDVMNRQREVIYAERRQVLEGADLEEQIRTFIDDVVTGYVTGATEGFAEEWDLEALWTALRQIYPVSLSIEELEKRGRRPRQPRPRRADRARSRPTRTRRTTRREAEVGDEVMRELERRVVLSVLDRKWREHLYEMDYLREGIYLRAYSQRDPLVEYQREGFDMFAAMMDGIKEESVGFLFNLEVQVEEEPDEHAGHDRAERGRRRFDGLAEGAPALDVEKAQAPQIRAKGLEGRSARSTCPTPRPSEDGEAEVVGGAAGSATTSTPGSAATPTAPAARARSSRSATAPPAAPPA